MATYEDVIDALRKADAAGDEAGARRLAAIAKSFAVPGRIEGAFEAAKEGASRVSDDMPGGFGFNDYMLARLPFGADVGAAGSATGRFIAGKAGYAPEIGFGEAFQQERALIRSAMEEYEAAHPGRALAGQVAGAAAFGVKGPAPTTLGATTRQGALLGGQVAGLYGASDVAAGDASPEEAITGTAIGVGFGATLPPVLAATVGLGKRMFAPATVITNRLAPQRRGARLVRTALERDRIAPGEAARRLTAQQRVNPEGVLADVGGENTRGLSRSVMNIAGAGREGIVEFVTSRNINQPDRIMRVVSNVLRNPNDLNRAAARLAAEREHIASPLYRQSFEEALPVNMTGVLAYIDDYVRSGVTKVADPLADLRPTGIAATMKKLGAYFATARNQRVGLKELHRVKEEIDGMIGVARRSGDEPLVRAIMGVKNRMVKAMARSSPKYDQARQIYSSTHDLEDALQVGRDVFRSSPDDIGKAIRGMTKGEREMVQIGTARAILDQVERRKEGHDVVKAVFGTPRVKATLKAAFQNDQAFRKFQAALMREAKMRRTADAVLGNSTTARQIADMLETNAGAVGRDALTLLLQGQPLRALASTVRQIIFGEPGLTENVARETAELLLSNNPNKVLRALQKLQKNEDAFRRIVTQLGGVYQMMVREGAAQLPRRLEPAQ